MPYGAASRLFCMFLLYYRFLKVSIFNKRVNWFICICLMRSKAMIVLHSIRHRNQKVSASVSMTFSIKVASIRTKKQKSFILLCKINVHFDSSKKNSSLTLKFCSKLQNIFPCAVSVNNKFFGFSERKVFCDMRMIR